MVETHSSIGSRREEKSSVHTRAAKRDTPMNDSFASESSFSIDELRDDTLVFGAKAFFAVPTFAGAQGEGGGDASNG